jgi:hypothetical protein
MEVVVCHEVQLEVEHLEDFSLLLDNVLGRDGEVSNLFGDYFGMKGEDVFVLRGHVEASYSKGMNIFVFEHDAVLVTSNEVLVKNCNC